MTDFVPFEPSARPQRAGAAVTIRAATAADVEGLALVMAVRGGDVTEHRERARRLVERLPVLSVAETGTGLVGWSGAQTSEIEPGRGGEWLVAGLTVVPASRRQGIAARLLRHVVGEVHRCAAGEPVYSVINARNLASLELHCRLGFAEVARAATFARVEFTGGEGVLLRLGPSRDARAVTAAER